MGVILIGVYICLTVAGLILFKYGSNKEFVLDITNGAFNLKLSIISIIGLCCYLLSFLTYIVLLPRFNLSYILPITSAITYVSIFLFSIFLLKETVTTSGIIGAIIILTGIIVMNVGK